MRSTCQTCKKKRYQNIMTMINAKSAKNGKPEWKCNQCIDENITNTPDLIPFEEYKEEPRNKPKDIEPKNKPEEDPTDKLLFNGVLMNGENCGYCHLAPKGVQLCDGCKERILHSGDFDKASRLNLYEYRYNVTESQWSHYNKKPLKSSSKSSAENEQRHSFTQRALRLKIELLAKTIQELNSHK